MKYRELHRKLGAIGCYPMDRQVAGHPAWYSHVTGRIFTTSNHEREEVATGTLRSIEKQSGLK